MSEAQRNEGQIDRIVILMERAESNVLKFRSEPYVNNDYDMGRVAIDLPLNDSRELLRLLKII